jgi:hypothetical protein
MGRTSQMGPYSVFRTTMGPHIKHLTPRPASWMKLEKLKLFIFSKNLKISKVAESIMGRTSQMGPYSVFRTTMGPHIKHLTPRPASWMKLEKLKLFILKNLKISKVAESIMGRTSQMGPYSVFRTTMGPHIKHLTPRPASWMKLEKLKLFIFFKKPQNIESCRKYNGAYLSNGPIFGI